MKEKKNIIKKISQFNPNKVIKLNYRKEIKFIFKKRNFKNKKFKFLLITYYSIKNVLKLTKYFKHNLFKTKNDLLINRNIYFNYITNGLDIKYDSQLKQNLYENVFISNYLVKKSLISKLSNLDTIKLHKFIVLIDNIYVNDYIHNDGYLDYFNYINLMLFSFIFNIYEFQKNNIINKLIKNCF